MIKIKFRLYLIYFIFFFIVLYLESTIIFGSLTIGQLWKGVLVAILMIYAFKRFNFRRKLYHRMSYYYAFKMFINANITYKPFTNIVYFIKYALIPLLLEYFKNKSTRLICTILFLLAQFIVLSSIPYDLGILESTKSTEDLSDFGFSNIILNSGIFQGVHAAALTYSLSFLVIFYFVFVNKNYLTKQFYHNKIYNLVLLAISLYSLYSTFARTGYVMFLIGWIIMIFTNKKLSLRTVFIYLSFLIIVPTSLIYLIQSNDALRARLFDERIYGSQDVGSGRLNIWQSSIDNWKDGNTFELLFGMGDDLLIEGNLKTIGIRVFSHNQYVDSLAQNGIIGLLLYVTMFISILIVVLKRKHSEFYRLTLPIVISYIMMDIFQGGIWPITLFIFVLSLVLIER